ncbi:hypothetical protein BWQ96_09535 [Gracilariopsis chorda]|uniref:Uncharacterized protein n=1 Tax=Gracilariopsis chorda TaxID=448386 RepID=A0A2V3IFG1_9FLOR|nr:hypothetical protein BWQ96_09535 [Gracilariopsis chorda]|eukprot:PXF40773.1 hypothetical protein BWQ96_09535 [Gracilariopsis chorda]
MNAFRFLFIAFVLANVAKGAEEELSSLYRQAFNPFFGANCKSKGCGIVNGPFGPVFFGGACKSKGCPVPPGVSVPGVPATPLPPAPPVCCTPDGCFNGYRTECLTGALSPRLAVQGYFVASGSCSGPLTRFDCRRAENVCSGNRARCVFRGCPPPPRPMPRPMPPGMQPRPKPCKKGHCKPYPVYVDRQATTDEEIMSNLGPKVDTEEPYFKLIDRMINLSYGVPSDIPISLRQKFKFKGGFGGCKSKGCPFGAFPGAFPQGLTTQGFTTQGLGGQGGLFFGGNCKSKGCGIVQGPFGPVYFGGACKSKGCPVPPGFSIGPATPTPQAPTPAPTLPDRIPPFVPPPPNSCCFVRPCATQRLCRCVLNK